MALKCRNFSRLVLIFTNVLFLVLGGLLIMIGGYMMSSPDLNEFTSDTISGAIIASGFLIVLVAALGCCGAHWESKVFLCPYATLVTVSIMSQLALAAFMLQLHKSLIKLSNLDYNVQHELLTTEDTTVLTELHNVFKHAYSSCAPEVDLTKTFETGAMVARCMGEDASYNWFADFVSQRCMITAADLMPNSPFQKVPVDPGSLVLINGVCSVPVKRSCKTEMIGVVVAAIGGFEIALVFLSCYLMCTQRRRSKGYQEIRMPLKMQHNNANVYHTMSAPYQQHNVQGTAMYAPVPNTDSRIKP
ncbi:hypothetical protein DYB32_002915 [Aphanomyces invadans]|uniref:Tetraspanin n=1 Tax=Aphanomyces invadans TaxID=157072 RepID=A0A418B2F8_9STRA|nr:hypothetical protein DYB32_002915 [Aphanomyces invadans]